MDQRKYQNAFYNELGINSRSIINDIESELAEQIDFSFQLEPGAKELLQELKKSYQIGLISNWGMDLYELLESLKIQDYFDSITISGEYGLSKPSLEIFKSGLADFPEVRPKHTVYIGDDYDLDILPAQDLNMFTILFDKGSSGMHGWPNRHNIKCPRVENLHEIPNLLNRYEKRKR
jgi:putative hydrolase of the HAD superfamily